MNLQLTIANFFDGLESVATDTVTRFAPWFTPLPTAWVTGNAVHKYLGLPPVIAVIVGGIVEGLGLSAMNLVLKLRDHNRQLRRDEKGKWKDWVAPTRLATIVVIGYFLSVVLLTILLDTISGLERYALILFPILSLGAFAIAAMHNQHRIRVDEMVVRRIYPYTGRSYVARRNELLAAIEGDTEDVVDVHEKATPPTPLRSFCWCGEQCPEGKHPGNWQRVHARHHHIPWVQGYDSPEAAYDALLVEYHDVPENTIVPFPTVRQVRDWWEKGRKKGTVQDL